MKDEFKCSAGYFCKGGSLSPNPTTDIQSADKGAPCSTQKYCPSGTTEELDCPIGTYNPYTGKGVCFLCPAGKHCPSTGLLNFANCPLGKYCVLATSGQDNAVDCPAGTYSNKADLRTETECLSCPPGKYCLGGKDAADGDCDAGFVCPRGSSTATPNSATYTFALNTPGICPQGYMCAAGSKSPTPCPVGSYQDQEQQSDCKTCPAGKYCDELAIDAAKILQKNCAAGYVCLKGSQHERPIQLNGDIGGELCKLGHYCPVGTADHVPCVAGTYSNREGNPECQECPAGFYCPTGSETEYQPVPCESEKYCPAGSPVGVYCPDGTFNEKTGLESD